MPSRKPLRALPQTAQYLLCGAMFLTAWLGVIKCYQAVQRHRSTTLQFDPIHQAAQREALQKKKKNFSVMQYVDEAAEQYLQSCRAQNMDAYRYGYYVHHYMRDFVNEHTDLVDSMRAHHPVLDRDTYTNLYLFLGPEGALQGSYCNLFAKKVGLLTAVGQYHFFMMLAGANNDPKRIARYQKIQVRMGKDPKRLYQYKGIFRELAEERCDKEIMDFYLRDKFDSKTMQLVKYTTRAEHLLRPGLIKLISLTGFDIKKELEESQIGAWSLKWLHLHLIDIEYLFNLDRFWNDLQRSGYTWMALLHYCGLAGPPPPGQAHTPPALSTGTFVSLINGVWWAGSKVFGGSGAPLIQPGGVMQVVDWLYFVPTSFLFFMRYMIKEPIDIFSRRFYEAYQDTFGEKSRYAIYTEAVNEGLQLLKQVERLHRLMRRFDKAIQKDKKLAALCEPYLEPIRYLLYSPDMRKLRYILRRVADIEDEPITTFEIRMSFSPFDTKITDILRLVKRFDELPEEEEKALMSALTAFCMLETFVSIATFAHENETKKATHRFALASIVPSDDAAQASTPDIHFEGIYTLFIPLAKVVKNDFQNVRDPKTGEEMIITLQGLNGAGKSITMRMIQENQLLLQAIGRIFGDKAECQLVDYIRLYANPKDNPAEGLSLMMAESKKLNEFLFLADTMAQGEKGLFSLDEPAKGTTTDEGGRVVLSSVAYLQQKMNILIILSTHINTFFDIAQKARYHKLAPFTPGFDRQKGFTYKMVPGLGKYPVCIHVLESMHFHPSVLKTTVNLLADDPNYRFRDKLRPSSKRSFFDALFGSNHLAYILLLLLLLLVGMLLGMYLPPNLGFYRRSPRDITHRKTPLT